MEILYAALSWGSPVGIGLFLFLMGAGAGVFCLGLSSLAKQNRG